MKKRLVFDLPTRVFHTLFGMFFISAFIIAKVFEDESRWFAFHSLCGLMLGALVLFRIFWGVVGTRYARLRSFALSPSELVGYFFGLVSGSKKVWAGHNPASSWSALLMWFFTIALVATGTHMASGNKFEALEEIHELIANGFMVVTVLHIGGVLLHSFRHGDAIAMSMLTGNKSDVAAGEAISASKPGWAVVLLAFVALFVGYLLMNLNSQSGVLQIFGTQFELFESEGEEGMEHGGSETEESESNEHRKTDSGHDEEGHEQDVD